MSPADAPQDLPAGAVRGSARPRPGGRRGWEGGKPSHLADVWAGQRGSPDTVIEFPPIALVDAVTRFFHGQQPDLSWINEGEKRFPPPVIAHGVRGAAPNHTPCWGSSSHHSGALAARPGTAEHRANARLKDRPPRGGLWHMASSGRIPVQLMGLLKPWDRWRLCVYLFPTCDRRVLHVYWRQNF